MSRRIGRTPLVIAILLVFAHSVAIAEDISFQAAVESDSLRVGQSVRFQLIFTGNRDVSAPKLPPIDGLSIDYMGPSSSISIVNTRISSSITHTYSLTAVKKGTYKLGPYSVDIDGKSCTSNELTVTVSDDGGASQGRTANVPQSNEKIFLRISSDKTRIYLGEEIPVIMTLYVNGVQLRNIQYPEFKDKGFSLGQPTKPVQEKSLSKDGKMYDVVRFRMNISPAKTGRQVFGPGRMECEVVERKRGANPVDDDFFSGFFGQFSTRRMKITSNTLNIEVLPIPSANRPKGYNGAIGDFSLSLNASPDNVKVGDPITLRMSIKGKSGLETVSAPLLKTTEGFKTYPPTMKAGDGVKTFEEILMPLSGDVREIPPVTFSFFNPATGSFKTIEQGPIKITVQRDKGHTPQPVIESKENAVRPEVKETLGKDIVFIKAEPGRFRRRGSYLYSNPYYLVLHILPIILFSAAYLHNKRRTRFREDIGYARRTKAAKTAQKGIKEARMHLNNGNPQGFYNAMDRTIRHYLGDRFHIPPGGLTLAAAEAELIKTGVDPSIIGAVREIYNLFDAARFAMVSPTRPEMEDSLKKLEEIIRELEGMR